MFYARMSREVAFEEVKKMVISVLRDHISYFFVKLEYFLWEINDNGGERFFWANTIVSLLQNSKFSCHTGPNSVNKILDSFKGTLSELAIKTGDNNVPALIRRLIELNNKRIGISTTYYILDYFDGKKESLEQILGVTQKTSKNGEAEKI
jgi:hypothetical protein